MEEKDKMTTDLDRRATLIRRKAKPPAGRERVERLGAEVIYAEERERSQVAQELNDSVGQKLADASFEIAASTNEKEADARAARRPGRGPCCVRQSMKSATSLARRTCTLLRSSVCRGRWTRLVAYTQMA